MKYASKQALIDRIESEHERFVDLAATIPVARYREEGVWGEGWTVKDLFAHLAEWEQMFLHWYREGAAGRTPSLPAEGYSWKQLPALNREIWKRHRRSSWKRVHEAFERSYLEILALAKGLDEEALLRPGHFAWTGKHPLVTYLGPNTASHYSAATRILKRWLRTRSGE
ncbi:MAG: ClbS/DfsB family four-helix bundle protein [Planctomycetota bacterium]|jgi:hypothetical protein